MKKSSQSDINRDNTSSQSEIISSHLINTKLTNSSSLSISDTSLDSLSMSYYVPNIYRTSTFSRVKASLEEKFLIVF
jgi:hypothetical protein